MTNGRMFNGPTMSVVVSTMGIAAVGHPIPEGCELVGGGVPEEDDWMEMEVVMGFRVWQLMFLALAGLITVVVLLCCFMKCRVPRTKQEIEADFKRKEITKRFRFLLDKVQIEDTSLRTALEKVNELYRNREKVKLSKKKKEIEEDEDIEEECSFDSNELFAEEKLTIIERIKRILKLERGKESDAEEDSAKTEQGKESDVGIPTEDEDDEDESGSTETKKTRQRNKTPLPQQKTIDSQDTTNEDSPKRIEDIRSTLSLLQDSPPPGSSRLSLLQDSPPHSNLTLLQDSPPESTIRQETLGRQKTDSQESDSSIKYRDYSRSKTDSQESRESQRSEPLRQKSSDSQDSKTSEFRKQHTETQESKKSGYRRQEATDSQDSRNSDFRKQKSDSQESKRTADSVKNHSDSQDSKTSNSNKQKSDSQDSKVTYPTKRNSGSLDSKGSSNPKTDSVDSAKSYGTRQKSDSQEFKTSTSNHRRMKSNSHDSKNGDSSKQNKNSHDSSKYGDSIRQLSDPQDSTNGYRLGNRRESLATNTTILKDFPRRENERFSKERKNNSFPSTSKLRRTSSKDLNMMCSNSKETSFHDTNLTSPVTEELQDNMNSATENTN